MSGTVNVTVDITAKGQSLDELIDKMVDIKQRYYPEWEFDRSGIMVTTVRMHASVEYEATALLNRQVTLEEPSTSPT